MFNHQYWIKKFMTQPGYNDASAYGVEINELDDLTDDVEFVVKVLGVHHLTPDENRSGHHLYLDVIDAEGQRINGATVLVFISGRQEKVIIEKPANEPGGNLPLWKQDVAATDVVIIPPKILPKSYVTIQEVNGVTTLHADEHGQVGHNTVGHHSFYVVFQVEPVGVDSIFLPFPEPEPAPLPSPTPEPAPQPDPNEEMSLVLTLASDLYHQRAVQILLLRLAHRLEQRALMHDLSRLRRDELEGFAQIRHIPYQRDMASPEYQASLKREVVGLHWARNRHHPEFHPNGYEDMKLMDIIEMAADWRAAGYVYKDQDFEGNLVKLFERFDIDQPDQQMIRLILAELGEVEE